MKSVSMTLCVWIVCGIVSAFGEDTLYVRERVRYVKDDGVEKIVVEERKPVSSLRKEADVMVRALDNTKSNDQIGEASEKLVDHIYNGAPSEMVKDAQNDDEVIKSTTVKSEDNMANRNTGLPVFITDDGKTIQLPQSDLLYNPNTGEILIRNRGHEDRYGKIPMESKVNQNIFNVEKSDNAGIKNLKGFVIDDDNMNKKILYPVTLPSLEITTRHEYNGTEETSNANENIAESSNEALNNTVTADEVNVNRTSETKESKDAEASEKKPLEDEDVHNIPVSLLIAMGPSVELEPQTDDDKIHKTQLEITVPLLKNSKTVMGRSHEKEFETKELEKNTEDVAKEASDDEPIYKFPNNEEIAAVNDNSREQATEKTVKQISYYDPHLFLNPQTQATDESDVAEIKNAPLLANVEISKSSVTVVTRDDFDESTEQFSVAKPKMMNIHNVEDDINDEHIGNSKEIKYVLSTTTEKPEPIKVLRNFLEDIFLRGPIAILVDVEPRNLMRTRELWTTMEATMGSLDIEDVVLFGYDIDGITTMSYHKGNRKRGNSDGDVKSLAKAFYGMTSTSKYHSGPGNPRMALTKAVQLLPYDSAVFIFEADRNDEESTGGNSTPVPGKLIKQLITKRLKVYCISSGQAWASGVAVTSGGSNIYFPVAPLTQVQASYPSQLQPHNNLQHHILYREYPHPAHYREMRALSVYYDTDDDDELVYDEQQILVLANNLTGMQSVLIHLDSGIRAMTVNISKLPAMAVLRGPLGIEINLLEESSISNFSAGSKKLSSDEDQFLSVSLVLIKKIEGEKLADEEEEEMVGGESSEYQGTWKLNLLSNKLVDVKVTAETNLRVMAKILKLDSSTEDQSEAPYSLKIAVGGSTMSIKEADIVDVYGNGMGKLSNNHSQEDETESDTTEIESLRALESGTVVKQMKIPDKLLPGEKFRVRVEGRNDRDEHFVRVSSILTTPLDHKSFTNDIDEPVELIDGRNISFFIGSNDTKGNLEKNNRELGYDHIDGGRTYNGSLNEQQQVVVNTASLDVQPMTLIQIGTSSKLYGAPGTILQIHFEVTNRRDNAVFFRFGARDDKFFLRSLSPLTQWINSGQTLNVVLTVGITANADNNIRDTITFTANGLEPMSLSLYVYVDTDARITTDRARPQLRHEFIGECMGYLSDDNCRERFWGLDIIARDTDSGVMRIAATPGVVYYQSNFFAGGRDESRARFTSNCCTRQVIVSATDVAGNMASYEVNVAQYFTPATIAAITLGVILAIILIIVIILLIRLCIKRRKTSRDLPSYSTQRAA